MEKETPKYQHWTSEEMALLAHLMSTALNAGSNQSEAAAFASSKLGRSTTACLGQYHAKMRNKPLSIWALPEPGEPEWEIEAPTDLQPEEVTEVVDTVSNDTSNMKITLHWGDSVHTAEILINTGNIVVAKATGVVITIEK
jgi:hypothetical protein